MTPLAIFLFSSVATLSFVASLFFLRFWRRSGDRFFLLFAISFAMMGLNRALLAIWAETSERQHSVFALRLLAHLVLLAAILDKNTRTTKSGSAAR